MQEETANKSITLTVNAGKFTAQTMAKLMKAYLSHMKNKSIMPKAYKGKQTVRSLMKSGEKLTNIEITDGNIKSFDRTARKYGVDYSLKKDILETLEQNGSAPKYLVFFKARDTDVLTAAFREFTAKTLSQEKKPTVHQKLRDMAEKAVSKAQERAREKTKTREAEL